MYFKVLPTPPYVCCFDENHALTMCQQYDNLTFRCIFCFRFFFSLHHTSHRNLLHISSRCAIQITCFIIEHTIRQRDYYKCLNNKNNIFRFALQSEFNFTFLHRQQLAALTVWNRAEKNKEEELNK